MPPSGISRAALWLWFKLSAVSQLRSAAKAVQANASLWARSPQRARAFSYRHQKFQVLSCDTSPGDDADELAFGQRFHHRSFLGWRVPVLLR